MREVDWVKGVDDVIVILASYNFHFIYDYPCKNKFIYPNEMKLYDMPWCMQGVLESFLGHALAGGIFCLLGGQPLTVLGCTGNKSVLKLNLYIIVWKCIEKKDIVTFVDTLRL